MNKNKPAGEKQLKNQKKIYIKPELKEYGAIHEFTKALTGSMLTDGGVNPSNKTMTCVSLPSYLEEHRWLLQDNNVQMQFQKALAAAVKPGDVVLDLGTGTGLHAFFAVQAGASRVYAVDSEPVLEMAKAISRNNGFDDRITFIQAHSDSLELPEKVDVIVTNIGFFSTLRYLPSVIKRCLKPGGKVLPENLRMGISLLEDESFFNSNVKFWATQPWGLDMQAIAPAAACRPQYGTWDLTQFISDTKELQPIDLRTEKPLSFVSEQQLTVSRTGVLHAIIGWYTYELGGGVSFSTKPPLRLSNQIWNQWALPFETPLKVQQGETVTVKIQLNLVPGYDDAIWRWEISTASDHRKQSSFDSVALSSVALN